MLRLLDPILRGAALALFAVYLAAAAPGAALRSFQRLGLALSRAGESPEEARRRVQGPEAAAAYDRLRAEVPESGEVCLFDGGAPAQASAVWARYELAPRKVRLLGRLDRLPPPEELRRLWPAACPFAVIALPERQAPLVLEKERLLSTLESLRAGR